MKLRNRTATISLLLLIAATIVLYEVNIMRNKAIIALLLLASMNASAATLPATAETPEPVSYITITAVEPLVAAVWEPLPMAGEPLPYTQSDIEIMAKAVWGEARGCSPDEQRLVVWCILQRVDSEHWPDSITGVVTQSGQFQGYDPAHPLDDAILTLCKEELAKWAAGEEAPVHEIYAPSRPFYYFDSRSGNGNFFREEWK